LGAEKRHATGADAKERAKVALKKIEGKKEKPKTGKNQKKGDFARAA